MSDPQPARTVLHDHTSRLAGEKAALASGSRRAAILNLIHHYGPMTIFEIAEKMELHDHQISGRFGEMERDFLISKTGERRVKPGTNCEAEVYGLYSGPQPDPRDAAELLGYPPTLKIADEAIFRRDPILGDKDLPGIPYSVHHASGGGLALCWRVEFIECPGCGRPIKFIKKGEFRCGTPTCNRTWYPLLVNAPGQTPVLALVMKHM